jgi:solute carrier family 25 aspartate/glutamate transporter 12/13
MDTMTTEAMKVKEVVKETLLGSEVPEDAQISARSKSTFIENSKKDSESGELYMGEEEFINAVAPEGEDYVSCYALATSCRTKCWKPLADV